MSLPEEQVSIEPEEEVRGAIRFDFRGAPIWLFLIIGLLVWMGWAVLASPAYQRAYQAIIPGIWITVRVTLIAFAISVVIGLVAGLGRLAKNILVRNLAITYIEFIRGVPIIVLIFTVAFVVVPDTASLIGLSNRAVPGEWRAVFALAVIYGAFVAEVFRAGIESVPRGQTEAARSLGMTSSQAMRHIVLPQAIRNVLPAIGNDFIAMLKDSSLVSLLAVRDITQQARLYAGSTFRFRETYLVLVFLYMTMTLVLSLVLQWYQRRVTRDR